MAQPSHIAGFLSLNNVLPYSLLCKLWIYYYYLCCGGSETGVWAPLGAYLGASYLPWGPLLLDQVKAPNWWLVARSLVSWWSRGELFQAAKSQTALLLSGKMWEPACALLKICVDNSVLRETPFTGRSGHTPPVSDWTSWIYLKSAPVRMYKLPILLIYLKEKSYFWGCEWTSQRLVSMVDMCL